MHTRGSIGSAKVISFSGIDGAGKSTQIEELCKHLHSLGMTVTMIRFWDDVTCLKAIRESTGHKLFKGDKGVGTPEAPITRKDKNIQSWPMTCIRLFLYFLDAISARHAVNKARRSRSDLVIFDRYCYDELVNLDLDNPLLRGYVYMLLKLIPKLDISYLLDADPIEARTRKPEYPLEFVRQNRAAYLRMQELTGRMTIISPMSVDDVQKQIWRYTAEFLRLPSHLDEFQDCPSAMRVEQSNPQIEPYKRPAA